MHQVPLRINNVDQKYQFSAPNPERCVKAGFALNAKH